MIRIIQIFRGQTDLPDQAVCQRLNFLRLNGFPYESNDFYAGFDWEVQREEE